MYTDQEIVKAIENHNLRAKRLAETMQETIAHYEMTFAESIADKIIAQQQLIVDEEQRRQLVQVALEKIHQEQQAPGTIAVNEIQLG